MKREITAALALLGLLFGCSSSSDGTTSGDTNADGRAGGAQDSGDTQGAAPGDGGDDAGNRSDGGSSVDGGQPEAARLYPIAVGYTWTYRVVAVGSGNTCAAGVQTSKVKGTSTTGGRSGFDISSFCKAAGDSTDAPAASGDEVDFYYASSNKWLVLVDPTLEEGHTWPYANTSFTWHRENSVTVPAGTFSDCWTARQNVSYTSYTTYCRGIGPVRSYSSDLGGNGWDAQLTAKSF